METGTQLRGSKSFIVLIGPLRIIGYLSKSL
jgi:hypothetical protein